ncbi:hypothetical protein MVEN_02456000 [Mycena venus]|uniref:DUF6534 domain-containing protein n=1 Tax=Mycena venus TaxID=2733690 RepID=A0A8H7CAG5_9AGAR|nr:hypothetical protein MVEN_02456000 [Mycena venus]
MRKTFQIKFFKLAQADIPYSTSALAFEVACDVLIAGAMIYHLLRNKTGFHKTDTAINLLVTYSLSSGAIATLFAICSLVTWITSPTTLIYALFYFVLVRVYGLSFMSLLNSREHVREQMFSGDVVSTFPSYPPVDTTLHMSDMSASVYDGKQEAV